ncbi:hypothetical protein BDF21DRAFT_422514 [Thamnidium elegans]|nr:hypothetical protein BDF21DRAFT_422514 [Thamnidium elegans]
MNDIAIMVPQAKLLMDYRKDLKAFFIEPNDEKNRFLYQYAKAREAKQKDGQRIRREEEEAKLLRNGKMIAYLAAENSSSEIQGGLRSRIVQEKRKKGKMQRKSHGGRW